MISLDVVTITVLKKIAKRNDINDGCQLCHLIRGGSSHPSESKHSSRLAVTNDVIYRSFLLFEEESEMGAPENSVRLCM